MVQAWRNQKINLNWWNACMTPMTKWHFLSSCRLLTCKLTEIMTQVCFYTFVWFKSITSILHRLSIDFKWVNYPISCTYLSLENILIFFITHTSETALEWIFPKFKHIYEAISSQQSPSIHLSAWKFLLKFKTSNVLSEQKDLRD